MTSHEANPPITGGLASGDPPYPPLPMKSSARSSRRARRSRAVPVHGFTAEAVAVYNTLRNMKQRELLNQLEVVHCFI